MKLVFPQDIPTDAHHENMPRLKREGGISFRDLAAIEICAQMAGALVFSNLDDQKKAKNLAAAPTMAVELADVLERELAGTEYRTKDRKMTLVLPKIGGTE